LRSSRLLGGHFHAYREATMSTTTNHTVYERITGSIIAALEQGVALGSTLGALTPLQRDQPPGVPRAIGRTATPFTTATNSRMMKRCFK
jgi:hypothetical protein